MFKRVVISLFLIFLSNIFCDSVPNDSIYIDLSNRTLSFKEFFKNKEDFQFFSLFNISKSFKKFFKCKIFFLEIEKCVDGYLFKSQNDVLWKIKNNSFKDDLLFDQIEFLIKFLSFLNNDKNDFFVFIKTQNMNKKLPWIVLKVSFNQFTKNLIKVSFFSGKKLNFKPKLYLRNSSWNVNAGCVNPTTVSATNVGGALTTASQPNITSVGTLTGLTMGGPLNLANQNITNGGTVAAAVVNATTLNATTVSSKNIGGTLTTALQPNITSVGALTGLTMGGVH